MEMPRFSFAAKCLAEAATTMSSAAQAMALAAQAFSSASAELDKLCNPTGDVEDLSTGASGLNIGPVGEDPLEYVRNAARSSIADSDYYLPDEDDDKYIKALLKRQQSPFPRLEANREANEEKNHASPSSPPPPSPYPTQSVPPESRPSSSSDPYPIDTSVTHFERHLMLDLETDVIPAVCALAQRFPKVVCYVQCALPSIMTYHRIIKSVTESTVYAITRPNISQSDNTWGAFKRQERVIILFPETLSSSTPLQAGGNICVIHLGWPSSTQRYRSQLALHDAPCSVLVACVQDQQMFPSCEELIGETAPWPSDDRQLLASEVSRLFPKFEAAIAGIPREMAEKFYQDWIEAHGPQGHRYVSSWDPIILVNRANLYICDVLGYNKPANDWSRPRFPPVPRAFVSRNDLDSAVDSGVLFLADRDPGLNRPTDLPKDISPMSKPSSIFTPEVPTPAELARPTEGEPVIVSEPKKPDSKGDGVPFALGEGRAPTQGSSRTRSVVGEDPIQSAAITIKTNQIDPEGGNKKTNEPTTKRTSTNANEYFVVLEDFHLIPAICLLAQDSSCKNIICYVQIVGVIQTLINQIQALTSRPIFIIASENSASLPGALKAFSSSTGGIVFCNYLLPLFQPLRTKPIHRIIHAGWTNKPDLYSQQINVPSHFSNYIVMTQSQYSTIPDPDVIFGVSQLNLTRSLLDPAGFDILVTQWENQLSRAPEKALNGCYMEWIAYHAQGQHNTEKCSAIELISQANIFAEKVLKKKGGRGGLAVSGGLARHLKLQPAVQAGILSVN